MTEPVSLNEYERWQRDAGLPHPPTEFTLPYRKAIEGEGADEFLSLGYQWRDKPHRLVFDLCRHIEELAALSPSTPTDGPADKIEHAIAVTDQRIADGENATLAACALADIVRNNRSTILSRLRTHSPTEQQVRHTAAILEEWNMKDPPDATCGHSYEAIARDLLTRLRGSGALLDEGETFESIIAWGDETFGPAEPGRIIERAWEEWKEMTAADADVPTEAADVIIVLLRMPGILEAIQRKMKVNRGRKWQLMGDGTGYHVPTPSPEDHHDQ